MPGQDSHREGTLAWKLASYGRTNLRIGRPTQISRTAAWFLLLGACRCLSSPLPVPVPSSLYLGESAAKVGLLVWLVCPACRLRAPFAPVHVRITRIPHAHPLSGAEKVPISSCLHHHYVDFTVPWRGSSYHKNQCSTSYTFTFRKEEEQASYVLPWLVAAKRMLN